MPGAFSPAVFSPNNGLLVSGVSAITARVSGRGYGDSGELAISVPSGPPPYTLNGLSLDADGRIVCVDKLVAVAPLNTNSGWLFDATGALVVVDEFSAAPPLVVQNGLYFDAFGAMVISGAVPALSLDFLAGTLPGGLTFSRASNATMFDSAGRLVWAPANLLLRSGDLSNAQWLKLGTSLPTVTSGQAAPDGTLTAWLIDTSMAVDARIAQDMGSGSPAFGSTATYSVWMRKAPGDPDGTIGVSMRLRTGTRVDNTFFLTSVWTQYFWTASMGQGASSLVVYPSAADAASGVLRKCLVWHPQVYPSPTADGTYVETAGSQYFGPRFDTNPATLAARGLLIEEARTNVLTYSRDFTQAIWAKTDITLSTTLLDISGVANAATLVTEGPTANAFLHSGGVVAAGSRITGSLVVRLAGGNAPTWIRILVEDSAFTDGYAAWFNLSTGAVGTVSAIAAGTQGVATSQSLGNGWWRFSLSCIPNGTFTTGRVAINSALSDANFGRVANATYGLDYAQLEVGAFPTSLVPTFGAAATRAQEVVSGTLTGWFNPAAGTLYSQAEYLFPGYNGRQFNIRNGTASRVNHRRLITNQGYVGLVDGASVDCSITLGAFSVGVLKIASNYGTAVVGKASQNGGAVASGGTAYTSDAGNNSIVFGSDGNGFVHLNGWLQAFRYYNTALSDAQLQALTA